MQLTYTIDLDEFVGGKVLKAENGDLTNLITRLVSSHGIRLLKGSAAGPGRPPIPRDLKLKNVKEELDRIYAKLRVDAKIYLDLPMPWPFQLEDQEKKIREMFLNEDLSGLTRFLYRKPWAKHTWRWHELEAKNKS